jgi:phospholipid/cholesterol/gamma-HCH transport system ATP-binding protein
VTTDASRTDPEIHGGALAGSDTPAIKVVNLHKSFSGRAVLKGVNLTVPRGTTTVILGGSGSGKTVLMKHLIGLLKPDSGEVLIDGEDIAPLTGPNLDRVRRKFGMVFQSAALFDSMTVGDNVAFPLKEHTKLTPAERAEKVKEKLALVSLTGVEARMPSELSGGMRKRVGLARAVVLDPQIVLYDEPTTGLDPITTDNVDEMILDAKAALGVTSVVISHDIGSAFKVADQIAFLYEGEIVAVGPPAEVRKAPHPRVQAFLRTWFEKGS